jgi:hypothetical protein
MLEFWLAATNDRFITTSPANSTPSPWTKKAVSPFGVRGTDHHEPHAHAAQVEHVLPIEGDVGDAPAHVSEARGHRGRKAREVLHLRRPPSANSASFGRGADVLRRGGKRVVAHRVLDGEVGAREIQLLFLLTLAASRMTTSPF